MRRLLAVLAFASWLAAAPSGGSTAAPLVAAEITPDNAAALLRSGPDAIGGLGDYALANDRIALVVDHPDRRHAMLNHGGTIVDLGLVGRAGDDQLARIFPLVNLSQRVYVDYDEIRAEVDPKGAFARVIVSSSGMSSLPRGDGLSRALDPLVPDPGALVNVRVQTVYEVRPGEAFVRLRTRFENRGDAPAPLFAYGDLWMRGGRSLRPFLGNALAPELARGFHHRNFSADAILSSAEALAPFSHLVMAGLPAYPPIAYALFSPERSAAGLSFFGVSGEHVNLACAFLTDPGWRELTLPRLLGAVRGELAPGAVWEIERRVLVTGASDVASATDRILPMLLGVDPASAVAGTTSPADLPTIVLVEDADGHPATQLRVEDGRYRATLPPGRYRLVFRTAHRPEQVHAVRVRAGETADAPPLRWDPVGAVRLAPAFDDGGAGRVIFAGRDGTPDPVFEPELLDFRLDGRAMPSATESRGISFAGTAADPTEIALPAGRYRLVATRGLLFDVEEREIAVRADETLALAPFALRRAVSLPGHLSVDFHVHSEASNDSGTTNTSRLRDFAAAGIDVLVATDHDNVADYDDAMLALGLVGRIRVLRGVEVTSSTPSPEAPFTLGHQNAWPIERRPWAHRRGAPPSQRLVLGDLYALLRDDYGAQVVQLNHPRPKRPKRNEQNYFTHQGTRGTPVDPSRPLEDGANAALIAPGASGSRAIDFDVIELMNGAAWAQYLAVRDDLHWLLRQGLVRAGTANSDTHGPDELAGLPRNLVRVGSGDWTLADLHAATRAGRSFGTTGPLIARFTVNGAGSGDTVAAPDGRATVEWKVVAAPWVPVDAVRLLVNGEVVRAQPWRTSSSPERVELALSRDAFVTLEAGAPLDADPVRWRAAHPGAYTEVVAPGFVSAAFANPVFVDVDGDGAWTPPGLPERARGLAAPLVSAGVLAAALTVLATWRMRRRATP